MRTVYDAWCDHDRYEDMDEYDKTLVEEYEADRFEWLEEQAERQKEAAAHGDH